MVEAPENTLRPDGVIGPSAMYNLEPWYDSETTEIYTKVIVIN